MLAKYKIVMGSNRRMGGLAPSVSARPSTSLSMSTLISCAVKSAMREVAGMPYPISDASRPISPDECAQVDTAICRLHGGRIRDGLAVGDFYGRVYLCPIGRTYWRLEKQQSGMSAPLKFPKGM